MSLDVWLAANTITYVRGAGQLWIYLNWALSLVDAGCRVTWVELAETPADESNWPALRERLAPVGPAATRSRPSPTGGRAGCTSRARSTRTTSARRSWSSSTFPG